MSLVTVIGAHGETVTLKYDSTGNAALAKTLASTITSFVQDGTILPAVDRDGPPPTIPAGQFGEWVQSGKGVTFLEDGYRAIISTARKATIFGTGEAEVSVLGSMGDLAFHSGGGSGTIVTGGGDNRIVIPEGGAGPWSIHTGDGDDHIAALGAGNDTVAAGGGRNVIELGGGHDRVISEGRDRIVLGDGSATIVAIGNARTEVFGGSGNLFFVGGAGPATIYGGTGSVTIHGGDGGQGDHGRGTHDDRRDDDRRDDDRRDDDPRDDDPRDDDPRDDDPRGDDRRGDDRRGEECGDDGGPASRGSGNEFHGGSAGNNVIHAGLGRATIHGGGDGDRLYAEGEQHQDLFAGPGAATLFGAAAGGDNSFHAGDGATRIIGGWGDDTFVGGMGASTITGGPGRDIYSFTDGLSGGDDLVFGFGRDDRIALDGYGRNAVRDALASQTKVAGGAHITLGDGTSVTFMGISRLTTSDFLSNSGGGHRDD